MRRRSSPQPQKTCGYRLDAEPWRNYGAVGYGDVSVSSSISPPAARCHDHRHSSTRRPDRRHRPARSRSPRASSRIGMLIALWAFVVLPFLACSPPSRSPGAGGCRWTDVAIALVFYVVAGLGITVGFHRYFTHGSFKAKRWLRIALAVAGSLAIEGSPIQWVADHRRHHAFSDLEGDPHSPWRYGDGVWGLTKGLFYAHMGWLFDRELSNRERFAPDLVADKDIRRVDQLFPLLVADLRARCRRSSAAWSPGPGRARCPRSSGPAWSASRCCTTSPGRSTRSATSTASGRSRSARATRRPTSGRWRSCRSARAGTTCTTPTRPAPGTACCAARSTSAPG